MQVERTMQQPPTSEEVDEAERSEFWRMTQEACPDFRSW
jgi:hypothetical protein